MKLHEILAATFVWWFMWVLYICHVCSCVQYLVKEPGQLERSSAGAAVRPAVASNLLFVALLDGKVVAIDAETGIKQWTLDTGTPLVSSQKGEALDSDIALDGTDGGLYVYRTGLERLHMTLPELVEASPSLAEDGSILLGSRRSTVYVVDTRDGNLISTFSDGQVILEDRTSTGINDKVASGQLLILGRQDFQIRSTQMASGQDTWNATFSQLHLLNPTRHPQPDLSLHAFLQGDTWGYLDEGISEEIPSAPLPTGQPLPRLVMGHNSLKAFGADGEGRPKWTLGFDAPPVGAYTHQGGNMNHLLGPAIQETRGGPRSIDQKSGGSTVLVGRLAGGSPYVIQADKFVIDMDNVPAANTPSPSPYAIVPSPSPGNNPISNNPIINGPSGPGSGSSTPSTTSPPVCSGSTSAPPGSSGPTSPSGSPGSSSSDPINQPGPTSMVVRPSETGTPKIPGISDKLVCPTGLHNLTARTTYATFLPKKPPPAKPPTTLPITPLPYPPYPYPPFDPHFRQQISYALFATLTLGILLPVLWYYISRALAPALPHHDPRMYQFNPLGPVNLRAVNPTHPMYLQLQNLPTDTLERLPQDALSASGRVSEAGTIGTISPSVSPVPTVTGSGVPLNRTLPAVLRRQVDMDGAVLVGRLRVGPHVLGYGSGGTMVYEGRLDGRPVAVKRMLRQFYELARKEIELLIVSDEHPNVVRCFAMEEDEEFVYMALERCRSSLSDRVSGPEGKALFLDADGKPSVKAMEVMHDVVKGLAALHERGIVHRDLKPHNVLLTDNGRAKLSDMGLSKQLTAEQSSFESHGAGGSSGWQAPEQLIAKDGTIPARQTRAMDVFSLGCVLYYCITGGRHPFGETYERDTNILRSAPNLLPLQQQPEAANLIGSMLQKDSSLRPTMVAVLAHPLWWSPETRLQFLLDVSDRVEGEDREMDQSLLGSLEGWSRIAVGSNWGSAVDKELISNIGKYRRYDYTSLRDLLRVIRNKRNHFREMPERLQEKMGPMPLGYLNYFASRFPRLLMAVYFFAAEHLSGDVHLERYWSGQTAITIIKPFVTVFKTQTTAQPTGRAAAWAAAAAKAAAPAAAAAAAAAAATDNDAAAASRSSSDADASVPAGPLVASDGSAPVVGYEVEDKTDPELVFRPFPKRPTTQLCDFFVKTGHCKYGEDCIYDHPEAYAVGLTPLGLPYREGMSLCTFYIKNNHCKFGPACKFHHPMLRPIYAGSVAVSEGESAAMTVNGGAMNGGAAAGDAAPGGEAGEAQSTYTVA